MLMNIVCAYNTRLLKTFEPFFWGIRPHPRKYAIAYLLLLLFLKKYQLLTYLCFVLMGNI